MKACDISDQGFHLPEAYKRITDLTVTNERALVLGGGGAAGNAWLIGIIAGLFDGGLDVTIADRIVGTSAGSTAAAQITGAPPTQLLTDIISSASRQQTGATLSNDGRFPIRSGDLMERTQRIIDEAEDAPDMRRKLGAALATDGASGSSVHTRWRAKVAARLPRQEWPKQEILIPAVDAGTGEPIVFNRDSGVDLVDAVAASCAGGFAYRIGERRYIDGAYRADLNADLATGYGRVLVIPPLGNRTRKPLDWGLHLTAQADDLRRRGSRVELILPDSDSQNALGLGMNMMNLSAREPSAQAGYNQGKDLAGQLTDFWALTSTNQ